MKSKLGVGLIGCGTVGSGVAKILGSKSKDILDKTGVELILVSACDSDEKRLRDMGLSGIALTTSADELIGNDDVDVIVELIGGTGAAFDITSKALGKGKPVVNANKALIATRGPELFELARKAETCMAFEASVCSGVPVVSAIRDGLVANRITSILGIVNGTSNFVLTRMTRENVPYDEALAEAQRRGYAEADPTLDVEGIDSAHKIAILARLAFGVDFDFDSIYTEGITRITPHDLKYAGEFGYVVKLLAIARNDADFDVRVHPALLPKDHPLSFVDGALNAVCVTGDATGDIILHGAGAGQMPTASAVVSDIVDVGLGKTAATFKNLKVFSDSAPGKELMGIENIEARYYARFSVVDEPGVLAKIAGVLGEKDISIASVIQMERDAVRAVPVVMMIHNAREKDMRDAMAELDKMAITKEPGLYMRVEQ